MGLLALGAAAAPVGKPDTRSSWTVQEVMDKLIDPSADNLWGSVGTLETAKGLEHRAPKSPADWAAVERQAQALSDGAALLKVPRPVGSNGGKGLADASTPGIRSAKDIAREISADPARFSAAADRLRHGAQHALQASKSRNADALLAAGAQIDAACEACHARYWYPRKKLTLPSRQAFSAYIWR